MIANIVPLLSVDNDVTQQQIAVAHYYVHAFIENLCPLLDFLLEESYVANINEVEDVHLHECQDLEARVANQAKSHSNKSCPSQKEHKTVKFYD